MAAKRRIPMPPPTRKRPGKRYEPEIEIEFEPDPDLDVDPVEALEILQDLGLLGPNVRVKRCKYED